MLISFNQLKKGQGYFAYNKENESNNENEKLLELLNQSKELQNIYIDQLYSHSYHVVVERFKKSYPINKLNETLGSEPFIRFD